jgi:predicted nucleic acid-binding Zn finger protein
MSSSRSNACNIIYSIENIRIIKNLEKNLLEQLTLTYEKDKCIKDELLESFYFLYKNHFLESLKSMDEHHQLHQLSNECSDLDHLVTLIQAKVSLRCIYKVNGNTMSYYIFEDVNYCTCPSFKYQVSNELKCDYLYCKHVILVKLFKAMNKLKIKTVDENEFLKYIKLMK